MNIEKAKIALVSGLVGVTLATGVQSFGQHEHHDMHGGQHKQHQMTNMQKGAMAMHEVMMKAAKKTIEGKMPMDSDTDRMFDAMMAEHHADGIRMAQLEIAHGDDPASKAIARKILENQTRERQQLLNLAKKAK